MKRNRAIALVLISALGSGPALAGCEEPGGQPVIETTAKPKHKKGTPAVEYHCFTNGGKKTCTPKARP